MDTTQKTYRFTIEPDAPIATLEAALQVVRRLGIDLRSLRTTATPHGMEVLLRVAAQEEDILILCRMRLHNLIGILPIREMPSLVVSNAVRPLQHCI
ncbi:hypothetical protein [Duganella callida]|uniref:Acetolactate synthase n=1 Tax=Duganella callida TaxID=2561932 RepID=A0A4Y9S0D7_9BURK|nr:hypothetical protein [Duganella callida]TFW13445.1 hypothetical protein E4L98_28985 [Duganella callida]